MPDWLEHLRAGTAGRYVIERELGHGGMATVYLARDLRHQRLVAFKVLRPELAASLGTDRFLREIAIAARLTHPYILPLHDSGEIDAALPAPRLFYYVMPYVAGESLRDRMAREGQLPLAAAVGIARQVAAALAYAHSQGVIHRDIKPENILLEEGQAVVADFGIARAVDAAAMEELSLPGLAIGTPAYMSPEQSAAAEVDGRSDVYSLGCVLYEMLAGEPPFTGPTAQAIQARHHLEPPRSLAVLRPSAPLRLRAIVDAALAKLPADRFSGAAALAEALERALDPATPPPARRRPAGRTAAFAAMIVALLLAAATVLRDDRDAAADGRAPVLLAAFDGPPDDSGLTRAVQELVTAELAQSPNLAVVPRNQVATAMREAGIAESVRVTDEVAREIAYRLSVKAVLGGTVRRVPAGGYALVLTARDAESGGTLASASAAAVDSSLVLSVQQLARQVREQLGDRRDEIEADKPLWQAATPSFPAFRKYVDAVGLQVAGDLDGSNRLFGEAIALDTGFAAAWAALGINHITARNLDSARLALGEALRRPDRLNDAQRYRVEAEAAYALNYDVAGAIRWYGLYLEEVPWSVGGRNNRGLFYSVLGRHEDALADFRRAIELERFGDAEAQPYLLNAVVELTLLGRAAEARAYRARLTGPYADYAALLSAAASSDWAAAERIGAEVASAPSTPPWVRMQAVGTLASGLVARGAPGEAEQRLMHAAGEASGAERRWYERARLLLAVAAGRPVGPVPPGLMRDTSRAGIGFRAQWSAAQGDTLGALVRLDSLGDLSPLDQAMLANTVPVVRAQVAARRNDWAGVLRQLERPARAGEHDNMVLDRTGILIMRWLVADAYDQAGATDSARAWFERVLSPLRIPPNQIALRGLVAPFAAARLRRLTPTGG